MGQIAVWYWHWQTVSKLRLPRGWSLRFSRSTQPQRRRRPDSADGCWAYTP
jgi:hypothetical protein